MFRDLPGVPRDVERMNELFSDLGYALVSLPLEPTANRLREQLTEWLSQAALGPSDAVVIYYSGHGSLTSGGDHYLCPVGFDAAQPALTGLKTQHLAEFLLAGRLRPGRFWLILDCCQAGGVFRDAHCNGMSGDETDTFILAASSSWGQVSDGSFSVTFRDAVCDANAQTTGGVVSLDRLVGALNQRWRGGRAIQSGVSARPFDLLDRSARPRHLPRPRRGVRARAPVPAVISWSLAKS